LLQNFFNSWIFKGNRRFRKEIFNFKWIIFDILIHFQIIIIDAAQIIGKLKLFSWLWSTLFLANLLILRLNLNNWNGFLRIHHFFRVNRFLSKFIRLFILNLDRSFFKLVEYVILYDNVNLLILFEISWQIYLSIALFSLTSLWS
jgi:hypothetical protein